MQVHGVKSGIVSVSNGGCNAFDINRSLAAGVAELTPRLSKAPLSTLALGIIATQSSGKRQPFTGTGDFTPVYPEREAQ